MPNHIFPANDSSMVVTPTYHGEFLEFGNAADHDVVGAVLVQFNPDEAFTGQFAVVGRARYQPSGADDSPLPLMPIAYIAVNVDGAANLRTLTTAVITGPGIIEIPANGLSVGIQVSCSAGTCTLGLVRLGGTVNGNVPAEV